jgi:hypothetical protein
LVHPSRKFSQVGTSKIAIQMEMTTGRLEHIVLPATALLQEVPAIPAVEAAGAAATAEDLEVVHPAAVISFNSF